MCRFGEIRGMTDFSDQFGGVVVRCRCVGCDLVWCSSLRAWLLARSRLVAVLRSSVARRWVRRRAPWWPRPKAILF